MMVSKSVGMGAIVLSALAVLAGCADTGSLNGAGHPAAGATRINSRFVTTDIPKLKGHLVDQVCGATGGPCSYHGRDMKSTHLGMQISSADFGALVQDLVAALDKFNVPAGEKSELLGILGPMKKDIVEVP